VKRLWVGIDVGGTFTDIVVYDAATGRQASHKELTTHTDPARGVMAGIDRLRADGKIVPADVGRVVHATTLFSNAVIERKGARTGLITSKGFRDTLEIGRERKYELYDIKILKPAPLVPRRWRLEVPERMTIAGEVHTPLDEGALLEGAGRLHGDGVTSLALVFLHSCANPRHERRAVELIAKHYPGLVLSASIDVAPEIREYERTSTTVINAYIKPLAERYLATLASGLAERAITAPVLLMTGERDPWVTPAETRVVFDALRGPKRLAICPTVGHDSCLKRRPALWTAAVSSFLADPQAASSAASQ